MVVPNQRVAANTTTDVTIGYEFKNTGFTHAKGVTLQAHVINVFDRSPPFFDSNVGYDPNITSAFPRSYDLTLRVKF